MSCSKSISTSKKLRLYFYERCSELIGENPIHRQIVQGVLEHAIYTLDPTGLVTFWNAGAEKVKGYTTEEAIGLHFSRFYEPEDQAAGLPAHALAKAIETGHYQAEGWRVRKDGTRFWTHVVIERLHDDDGQFIGFSNIGRDCTEQHRIQIEALEFERRYRILVQGTTDYAIYMLDLEGMVTNWNAGAELAKGYKAEEIVGQHVSRFYTLEDQAIGVHDETLAVARREGRFEGEGWRVRKDGSRFWAHVVLDLIHDDDGKPIGFAKITKDRTQQRQVQADALESERRFRHLVQGVTDYAIYMLDPQGLITNWNAGAERAKGYRAEEIVGRHFSLFFTPEDLAKGLPDHALATALDIGRFEAEGWRLRKDGSSFWAHVVIDTIRDEDQKLIGFAKITRDITRQKGDSDHILQVTRTLDVALSNMKHGLCVFDGLETLQLANRRFVEMFEQDRQETLIGLTFRNVMGEVIKGQAGFDLTADSEPASLYRRHIDLIRAGSDGPTIEELPSGMAISVAHSAMPDGSWVSTFEDVTERMQAEATISKLASQDSLTGLANRRAFQAHICSVLTEQTGETPNVLMLLDLDEFKAVNDTYGHGAGDVVLKTVADRIRACLRPSDLPARLGGDEYAIILHGCTETQAAAVANRLITEIGLPLCVKPDVSAHVGVSIGITQFSDVDNDADNVLMQADLALYDAKARGKNIAQIYSSELNSKVRAQRELEFDLREAIETESGFTLHYQPLINVATGAISVREGLLRWNHPRQGNVPPSIFIPLAEELGLIRRLGVWVLHQACSDARHWSDGARVSINVSPLQLGENDFSGHVVQALASSGLSARSLEIEITETTLLDNGSNKLDDLHQLHGFGVRVALDDFGKGSASLAHVRAFPFDRIKIDGSFIRDAMNRTDCAVIVGIVVELGRRLGIAVVAEGIETQEHLALAKDLGCDEVQGYFLGRPTPLSGGVEGSVPIFGGPNTHVPSSVPSGFNPS